MFKHFFKKEEQVEETIDDFKPGTLIPQEVIDKRVNEQNNAKSFEALRVKVQKADELQKMREERERQAQLTHGIIQDHGEDQELGQITFDIIYDVGTEMLKVTLIEAAQLLPFDPLQYILNVRVSVTLRNSKENFGFNDIKPRPKFKQILIEPGCSPHGPTQPPNGHKSVKTPILDAASSSIFWQTTHPVWNEIFIFEEIKNKSLKKLDLVFTVFDRHAVRPPLPPREDILGEARIPLRKVHKTLARVPKSEKKTKKAAEKQNVEPVEAKKQIDVEILPPRQKFGSGVDFVYRWLNDNDDSHSDIEMEELASICNSEPVRDLLQDPELMDSVSIREVKMSLANNQTQLDAIQKLVAPENEKIDEIPQIEEEKEDSEVDLPASKRPRIRRSLEGWKYINHLQYQRPVFGELKIGLKYETNISKLTVMIAKGKKLRDPTAKQQLMNVYVTAQRMTKIFKKATPFTKRPDNAIELKENPGKIRRTSIREQTDTPVWDTSFEYTIAPAHIHNMAVNILVYSSQRDPGRERVIGGVRLGQKSIRKAMLHWQQMVNRPGFSFFMYYKLQ